MRRQDNLVARASQRDVEEPAFLGERAPISVSARDKLGGKGQRRRSRSDGKLSVDEATDEYGPEFEALGPMNGQHLDCVAIRIVSFRIVVDIAQLERGHQERDPILREQRCAYANELAETRDARACPSSAASRTREATQHSTATQVVVQHLARGGGRCHLDSCTNVARRAAQSTSEPHPSESASLDASELLKNRRATDGSGGASR